MPKQLVKKAIAHCVRAEPSEVASAIVAVLQSLHAELTLVVGVQAASALCAHAVHRTRSTIGWTMPASATITDKALEALRQDLASRTAGESLSAGEFLLNTMVDHLISLIGQPLTIRLLKAAWSPLDAGPTSQENLS